MIIMNSRRRFIRNAGLFAGSSVLIPSFHSGLFGAPVKKMAASDRIHIGAIGINGMGWADLLSSLKQPGVEVVMLCDVDKNVLDKRLADLVKLNLKASGLKADATGGLPTTIIVRAHRDTACWCCGEVDDPNGKGPAINTGFCAECKTAGCPDQVVCQPCAALIRGAQ